MARRGEATPASDPPKTVVTLPNGGPIHIDPNVDPSKLGGVAAYSAGIMARRGGRLPKADMPLEQTRPPIPVLSGGPSPGQGGGHTMADFARLERAGSDPRFAQAFAPEQGGIIEEPAPMPVAPAQVAARPTAANLGLAPVDLLPEQAKADPLYRQGYGSEFASNQPELAAKYGVIRNGQYIPPQKLGGGARAKSSLSPSTVQGLEELRRMQNTATAPGLDQSEEEGRRAVLDGVGGSAARVGGVSAGDSAKSKDEKEPDEARKKMLADAIDKMDAFEFNQWRQLTMREILHSEKERETIEKRLEPLDIGQLIKTGKIIQRIPIIPGKYEITLQSHEGQVELALKRIVMMESRSVDVGDQYLLDKHSFMSVAAGLVRINDKPFPDILDQNGVFSDELFFKKFNEVMKLPIHMLASIGVNLMWFEMRVRKLYSATAVGNG